MKRYVWLNLSTGEFSNSWTDEDYSIQKLLDEMKPEDKMWKLIEFNCLSDPDFVFTQHMKLR